MNMTKKICFDEKEIWDLYTYYYIYIDNDIKMIKFIGDTDRKSLGKNYLSWICIYYDDKCNMPLDDFLMWDVYYQKERLCSTNNFIELEKEPMDCYKQSNEWLKSDGSGSCFLKLLKITKDTPCGYYYGY